MTKTRFRVLEKFIESVCFILILLFAIIFANVMYRIINCDYGLVDYHYFVTINLPTLIGSMGMIIILVIFLYYMILVEIIRTIYENNKKRRWEV